MAGCLIASVSTRNYVNVTDVSVTADWSETKSLPHRNKTATWTWPWWQTHTHTHTCSLVIPALTPIRTWPSSSCATFGTSTLRKSLTNCVTSTCQSLPSRKLCWPRPSSSPAPLTSPVSATKCVRTRRVVLWYWATQPLSFLSPPASSSSFSSVTLSYLYGWEKEGRRAMVIKYGSNDFRHWGIWRLIL